ncbi:hypothetical protein [Flavobacterium crassostreae]|uniref:Lipoprotein n=1 Tax=Flavobacterium crassostreae TaxID=1763534 RepID=A0A1B9DXJ3_9FLAO|nr:hypothetical protein [Flavobacterium crassostreae]OCB74398.1 hypothetical protein LPBF_10390 [Flavobacterium crassostreae]
MKKNSIILILLIGLFLMPASVLACGTNSNKKNSCNKEMAATKDTKSCCQKTTTSQNKPTKGCSGKCGGALCSVPVLNIAIVAALPLELKKPVFNFATTKHQFYQSVSFPLKGYVSIWLIPKIG